MWNSSCFHVHSKQASSFGPEFFLDPPKQRFLKLMSKNHAWGGGAGFDHINCSGGLGFDRGWEVAKFSIPGLLLPKIAFSVSIQRMKQNLLSVLRTVKYAVMLCN